MAAPGSDMDRMLRGVSFDSSMPGEKLLFIVDPATVENAPKFAVGDHVMGLFQVQNSAWYPGTLAELHEDGSFTMHYDDGDVGRLTLDRIRTHEEHSAAVPGNERNRVKVVDRMVQLDGIDGTVVKCNRGCKRQFSLAHLFDFKHGRHVPEDEKEARSEVVSDWRVAFQNAEPDKPKKKVLDEEADVKILVLFGKPQHITRIRVFGRPYNWKDATSNFLLSALPASTFGLEVSPVLLTPQLVECQGDKDGDFHEYHIQRMLDGVVIRIPPLHERNWATLAGVDFYTVPALDSGDQTTSSFRSDFGALLASGLFADCIVQVENRDIPCHKAILCMRSEFFRNMFNSPMHFREQEDAKTTGKSQVVIPDVSYDNFLNVLKFIYTDEISDVKSIPEAVELWRLADRFQLTYLRNLADNYLEKQLDCHTAMEICQMPTISLHEGLHNRLVVTLARTFDEAMDTETFVDLPKQVIHDVLKQVKTRKAVAEARRV